MMLHLHTTLIDAVEHLGANTAIYMYDEHCLHMLSAVWGANSMWQPLQFRYKARLWILLVQTCTVCVCMDESCMPWGFIGLSITLDHCWVDMKQDSGTHNN